jgi:hypothetical protein
VPWRGGGRFEGWEVRNAEMKTILQGIKSFTGALLGVPLAIILFVWFLVLIIIGIPINILRGIFWWWPRSILGMRRLQKLAEEQEIGESPLPTEPQTRQFYRKPSKKAKNKEVDRGLK